MKLIVGLGNPGREYKGTRHNVGYEAVERLANRLNVNFKLDTKLEGELAILNYHGEKVIILKPVTYMNLSGNSVIKVFNYYKLQKKDMIVIYDDMDLCIGKLRIRSNGSAGGHNGIKSIISSFSSMEFNRVRVGIDKKAGVDVVDYVLGRFNESDQASINLAYDKIIDLCLDFMDDVSFDRIMNKYNTK